jgi:serine/threonine-protein kinase
MRRGQVCRGYDVWGKLSEGGMSEVWLARHTELGLPVILKTLRPGAFGEGTPARERVRDEARLMARITSSGVVRVLDFGVDQDSTPFLVQEYVDGIDLAELDRRRRAALRRPLPVWAVAELISEAAGALKEVHQGGVVHCDVKPSNLFFSPHGRLKVGDFGVATSIMSGHTGALGGTPGFMAPEQRRGGRVDFRTDVYALGATAFALRYGAAPFANATGEQRRDAVLHLPPARSPEEAYFQHLVARMMSPRPEARIEGMFAVEKLFGQLARATRPAHTVTSAGERELLVGGTRVVFKVGDISLSKSDGIVSSANCAMQMRAGVGAALVARGGEGIEVEAMAGGERALGECVVTGAGRLDCRGVLHAVGAWNEVSCVARATQRALLAAEELGYETLSMPAVGTGQGRVGIEGSADAMVSSVERHLALGGSRLREVRFVLVDEATLGRFANVARGILLEGLDPARGDDSVDAPVEQLDAESAPTVFASNGALVVGATG